jgi:hypothetical protein
MEGLPLEEEKQVDPDARPRAASMRFEVVRPLSVELLDSKSLCSRPLVVVLEV